MQHYNYRTALLTAVYKTEHGPFLNNNKKNGNMDHATPIGLRQFLAVNSVTHAAQSEKLFVGRRYFI
jgi:hypothetical protein